MNKNATERIQVDTTDPATRKVGPNGGRVGYLPNGDLAEVSPGDDHSEPGEEPWLLLLRRSDVDIREACKEFRDKVWWNLHQRWLHQIESGEDTLDEKQNVIMDQAKKAAQRIEQKYGRDALGGDAFERGVACGRLSALSWVLGSEWEDSMDV